MGEKRGHPRVPIELKVEYKKVNAFFFDFTRNISKDGTFIKTPQPLDAGTEFTFKLVVPHLPEPLVLRGRVKWMVDADQAGQDPAHPDPGMGIQFVYDTAEDRAAVHAIVEKLMIAQLGERASAKLLGRE